jgi:hypothetical protein
MRAVTAVLCTIAATAVTIRAGAEGEGSAREAPQPTRADVDALRAELARQAAALDELRATVGPEKPSRERSTWQLSGYAQVDWFMFNEASQNEVDHSANAPLNQDRFSLRRGHLRMDARQHLLSGVLEIDLNTNSGPQVRPIDAEVALRWPEEIDGPYVEASLGLMKIPFGFEVPERDRDRPFLERSTVMRALFPGEFDLGARISGRWGPLEGSVALMNGNPLGDKVFPALAPVGTKDLVGRLGAGAEIIDGIRIEAGVSVESGIGFHEGTPTTKDQLLWRDENGDGIVQATEIEVISGSSATPSQTFRRFALGADARVAISIPLLGELAIRAELARGKNLDRGIELADPVGAGHDLRELGFYVGATQEITNWAMIGARYDRYDPDQDASEQRALNLVPMDRSYSTLALLAMLRYQSARLSFEYDRNGNALGRDASGAPTTLKNDAFTMRGQVAF